MLKNFENPQHGRDLFTVTYVHACLWWVQDCSWVFAVAGDGHILFITAEAYLMSSRALVHACSVAQPCPALCNRRDCSLPGSSIHGILQEGILEWKTIPFSKGSSQPGIEPGSSAMWADSLPFELPGLSVYIQLYINQADYTVPWIIRTCEAKNRLSKISVQFSSVAQSCPTL